MTDKPEISGYVNRNRNLVISADGTCSQMLRLKVDFVTAPDTLGILEEELLDAMISGDKEVPVYHVSYYPNGRKKEPYLVDTVGTASLSSTLRAVVLKLTNGNTYGISFDALMALIEKDRHHCAIAKLKPAIPQNQ